MRHGERAAFTLLEVIAALALAGIVLLGAGLLLARTRDDVGRIGARALLAAARANGERVLRDLVLDADLPRDSLEPFTGDARMVALTSWCVVPGGWRARCRATVTLDSTRDSTDVLVDLATGEHLIARRIAGPAALVYSASPGDSTTSRWGASLRLPAAIGLVEASETSWYAIGVAGHRD